MGKNGQFAQAIHQMLAILEKELDTIITSEKNSGADGEKSNVKAEKLRLQVEELRSFIIEHDLRLKD
ncbi:MAG TPA: hypothetical protein VEC36_05605 [Patescibacteria group bacterium]|nr:hypothetical protein [Patescibacteria group bacterium]